MREGEGRESANERGRENTSSEPVGGDHPGKKGKSTAVGHIPDFNSVRIHSQPRHSQPRLLVQIHTEFRTQRLQIQKEHCRIQLYLGTHMARSFLEWVVGLEATFPGAQPVFFIISASKNANNWETDGLKATMFRPVKRFRGGV